MGRLVAIGGGKIDKLETLPIDREIVRLTGKRKPTVLFIPTASGDAAEYCDNFRAAIGGKLGCSVEPLLLYRDRPAKSGIKRKILSADVIYVGGGNTLRMMKLWRRLGVDRMLTSAWTSGTVLSGVSAGAICWMKWGLSDSRSFSGNDDWEFIRVRGLGLLDVVACPHYHSEKREQAFEDMVRKQGGLGVAINENAALEVVDDRFRILTSKDEGKAYRLFNRHGNVAREEIVPNERRAPLTQLLVH